MSFIRKKKFRNIPPTSAETMKSTRKDINAKNRSRSKTMERNIAKTLRGRRTPMSGGMAAYKGDVEIPFINNPGHYIIECKLSAQSHNDSPSILFKFEWLDKIELEAKYMNAKFGILIAHYMQYANDYVFIKRNILDRIIQRYDTGYTDTLIQIRDQAPVIDLRYDKNGKARRSCWLLKDLLDTTMISYSGIEAMKVVIHSGEYYIIHLNDWQSIMESV